MNNKNERMANKNMQKLERPKTRTEKVAREKWKSETADRTE